MTAPQVARYHPDHLGDWDRLAAASRSPHFLFQRGYMDYHADRFRDHSFMAWSDGEPVALLPANATQDELVSHGGLTFGGLLAAPSLRIADVATILDAVRAGAREAGLARLVYKALPPMYTPQPSQEDLYLLHQAGAQVVRRDVTSTVDLRHPGPVAAGRLRSAQKARKHGVAVAETTDLAPFWAVLERNLAEHHGVRPVHSLAEMSLLQGRFPQHIRLFTARLAEETLAGVLVYETPRVAHAQYIASSPAGRDAGAQDQLFLHLLDLYRATHAFFDFGISTEQQGRVLNQGLISYKEGFGARGFVHDTYALAL